MSKTYPICPMCEEARLRPATYVGELEHQGSTIRVKDLERYICDQCGADPVFEDQIRRNHRKYVDVRRRADGLMTSDEIRSLRRQFRLTQSDTSRLFGGGPNAFSKYERGDVVQSIPMDRLLKLIALQPQLLSLLRFIAGEPKSDLKYDTYFEIGSIQLSDKSYQSRVIPGEAFNVEKPIWKEEKEEVA